uniref:Glycine-rich protein n=1 Tax=Plectus sambesii TaxID=2011161 RepID=A0A914XJQ0_9BILA
MRCHFFAAFFLALSILASFVNSQPAVDVNPLMINVGPEGVGLGTKWNFFGQGFSSGSGFGPGGYSNKNLINGGPFNLGSFWSIGRRRRR